MVETQSLSMAPIADNDDGRYPIANIVLLGQFNYDVPIRQVENWVQIWSRYFTTVSVVGPFSEQTYRTLRQAGIDAYLGADDKGFVSPIQNVVDALERASSELDAVLYVHDDGLLNLSMFFQGQAQIPTDKFMGNLQHVPDSSYSITIPPPLSSSQPLLRNAKSTKNHEIIYDIPSHNSTPTVDRKQFLNSLPKWKWKGHCLQQQLNMLTRPNSQVKDFAANFQPAFDSQEGVRSLQYFFASNGQMDFLLIPTRYKDIFARIAQFFVQDRVFLECAFPTIVLWVLQEAKQRLLPTVDKWNADEEDHDGSSKNDHGSSRSLTDKKYQGYVAYPEVLAQETTFVPVCTSWNRRKRGTPEVLEECLQDSIEYGMYHPVKLSSYSTCFASYQH